MLSVKSIQDSANPRSGEKIFPIYLLLLSNKTSVVRKRPGRKYLFFGRILGFDASATESGMAWDLKQDHYTILKLVSYSYKTMLVLI